MMRKAEMPVSIAQDPSTLYSDQVRGWARKVRADKRLAAPDASITRTSRLCGSTITLDVRHRDDTITALGWYTRTCSLGMAATAVLVHAAPGRRFEEVGTAGQQLACLLAGAEADFPAGWEMLAMFSAARELTVRHGAILLPFEIMTAMTPDRGILTGTTPLESGTQYGQTATA